MEIKAAVRDHYATRGACCGPADAPADEVPSLGCGTPLARADLRPGETVVDLGSGPGRDLIQAARQVGPTGRAIGVDMTPEMVARARANARDLPNVEVLQGEIESLPLPSESADVVISNCVINLSPDKDRVFREAHRVLRPGGRFVVQDILATRPFTEAERADPDLWSACVSGAVRAEEYRDGLRRAGFADVEIHGDGGGCGPGDVYAAAVVARKTA